ncbi:glutathione-regulated potassium-efflux system ancillary protein KefG [Vibrio zhugei]|uniref:Glutathione-regulated potassium-efflux system ancillary protein KefG n=1 Tax=Vibrio zhugei TaxID=2479546 RepID=A0ABV7C5J8_9VIBR|nr:glutathione-regulated potassium-efflux system ancillary protein KefG [Vibrio zhugei]
MTESHSSAKPLPKILIIYAHPDPDQSVANKILIRKARQLEHVTIVDLYATYPDFFIDVHTEHQRLLSHDVIVFQHPLYMYSCPSLLKEWIDCVLGKGFAFGDYSALQGKYWRHVITTGGREDAFSTRGYNRFTIHDLLRPFEITSALCRTHWIEPFVLYWARNVSDLERYQQAERYKSWLDNPELI